MASTQRSSRKSSLTPTSSSGKKSTPASRKPASRKPAKAPTPPAASVAAAQKVLRSVERREAALRTSLERHTKALKKVKKSLLAPHHGQRSGNRSEEGEEDPQVGDL